MFAILLVCFRLHRMLRLLPDKINKRVLFQNVIPGDELFPMLNKVLNNCRGASDSAVLKYSMILTRIQLRGFLVIVE